MTTPNFTFDRDLIEKCQSNAPRYTSYPTADKFNTSYTGITQLSQINNVFNVARVSDKISLYIHIPYCNTLCLFCACNKIITNNRKNITTYIQYLEREIKLYRQLINNQKLSVIQLHFGGGSPSWLSQDEITQVMSIIKEHFDLSVAEEIAMEIDPRHCDESYIKNLKNIGFTRISIGVQDFNPKVQKAVNRVQSFEESNLIIQSAKKYGLKSTNVDLIYGLPFQNVETFTETIDKIISIKPDRIALFNYAHVPSLSMAQTRIKEEDLPLASVKLDILQMSVKKLTDAGYIFIGMDHFALPTDSLSIALKNGTIQRNFQGYSTFADTNLLAFGVSSIGFIGDAYYQNQKDITQYYACLDKNELPILRGVVLTRDDIIRKCIIQQVMCKFGLDFRQIEELFGISFASYFIEELQDLNNLQSLGLITLSETNFNVSAKGQFLIRNVAVVFDKYYRNKTENKHYSKVI